MTDVILELYSMFIGFNLRYEVVFYVTLLLLYLILLYFCITILLCYCTTILFVCLLSVAWD